MRQIVVVAALVAATTAFAAEDHAAHMSMKPATDARKLVEMPDMMRQHFLANMQAHFTSISDITAALAAGDGARAAKLADAQLSLASPHSAACKPGAENGAKPGDQMSMMAAHMAGVMPQEMRDLGYTMHEQASAFSDIAGKMKPGDDVKPALAQLAKVTQACGACHAAFRVR